MVALKNKVNINVGRGQRTNKSRQQDGNVAMPAVMVGDGGGAEIMVVIMMRARDSGQDGDY
jgi:hypothetical protein